MNRSFSSLVLLAQLAATLFMTGLIWIVQVVHYPLFAEVGSADFSAYEQRHQAAIFWVVAPPMLVEGVTAVALFWFRPRGTSAAQLVAGVALLAIVWLSTAFVQIPCHEMLARAFDLAVHQRLVQSNWIRTAAWSLRGLLVLWMTWNVLKGPADE